MGQASNILRDVLLYESTGPHGTAASWRVAYVLVRIYQSVRGICGTFPQGCVSLHLIRLSPHLLPGCSRVQVGSKRSRLVSCQPVISVKKQGT